MKPTRDQLLDKILDRFESALDNEADNASDQGWTEYADVLECDLSDYTEQQLDAVFDEAFVRARQAFDEIRDQRCKEQTVEEEGLET